MRFKQRLGFISVGAFVQGAFSELLAMFRSSSLHLVCLVKRKQALR